MNNNNLTELLNPNRGPTIGDIVMYIDDLPGVLSNKVYSNFTILNTATQWISLYPPLKEINEQETQQLNVVDEEEEEDEEEE